MPLMNCRMLRITTCGAAFDSLVHDMKLDIFREKVDSVSSANDKAYVPIDSPGPLNTVLLRGWPGRRDQEQDNPLRYVIIQK